MKKVKTVLLGVFIAILTLLVNETKAQGTGVTREKLVIGLAAGGGILSLSDNEADFSQPTGGITLPNLKIGWMLNSKTALVAVLPGMIYTDNQKDRSFEAIIPSIQYWVSNQWWVSGGVGMAMDFPAFYEVKKIADESWNLGCAASVAAGYEIVQRSKFAIDLQGRAHLARIFQDDHQTRDGVALSIGIGFNWY